MIKGYKVFRQIEDEQFFTKENDEIEISLPHTGGQIPDKIGVVVPQERKFYIKLNGSEKIIKIGKTGMYEIPYSVEKIVLGMEDIPENKEYKINYVINYMFEIGNS